jgi:hypothetical protein
VKADPLNFWVSKFPRNSRMSVRKPLIELPDWIDSGISQHQLEVPITSTLTELDLEFPLISTNASLKSSKKERLAYKCNDLFREISIQDMQNIFTCKIMRSKDDIAFAFEKWFNIWYNLISSLFRNVTIIAKPSVWHLRSSYSRADDDAINLSFSLHLRPDLTTMFELRCNHDNENNYWSPFHPSEVCVHASTWIHVSSVCA